MSPERLLEARGVYGFWPAASDGDDIIVFGDESRSGELLRFNMLRQQEMMPDGDRTCRSPISWPSEDRELPTTSAHLP